MALATPLSLSESFTRSFWPLNGQASRSKGSSSSLVQLPLRKCRRRFEPRALTVAVDAAKASEEEYGSRYERPDRYPRLRRSQAPSDQIGDARRWLEEIADVAVSFAPSAESSDQSVQDRSPVFPEDVIRRQQLLVRQGRLDEVLDIVRSFLASTAATSALPAQPFLGFSPTQGVIWGGLDHSDMLEACADASNVELAFEYASLFPPAIGSYAFLAAAFALRGDPDVAGLAVRTAERRGAQPDAILSLAYLASSAKSGNIDAAEKEFDKMLQCGVLQEGVLFKDVVKACLDAYN